MSAHFVTNDDGGGYWREFLTCSDGRVVCAQGLTPQQAEKEAKECLESREAYLRLSPKERLRILAEGNLLSTDMAEALRLLIQLICPTCSGTDTFLQHVIINGRDVALPQNVISYEELIELVYPGQSAEVFTVTYCRGHNDPGGTLIRGQSLTLEPFMIIGVTDTSAA